MLTIDGSGVAALVGVALVAAARERSRESGAAGAFAATAFVGAVGFALAATAVGHVGHLGPEGVEEADLSVALRLVAAGGAVNTVGCFLSARAARRRASPFGAAIALLVGGNILSALYVRELLALTADR